MRTYLPANKKAWIRSMLLILGILSLSWSFAQTKTAVIKRPAVEPVIDGIVDQVWAQAQPNNIALPFRSETPTLGTAGQTWWKGFWTLEGIYILVNVADDVFSPAYAGTGYTMTWMYDKVELYIDANYIQQDGLGAEHGKGHYCFAPAPSENMIHQGQAASINFGKSTYCYKVSNQAYVAEYYIPFTELLDKNGLSLDKSGLIGFDITIVDNDLKTPLRNRMVWSNNGRMDESWYNMDDAGLVALEGCGCPGDTTVIGNDSWSKNNLIRNWNFTSDLTNWGGWVDGAVAGQMTAVVENGVAKMATGKAADGAFWHYQLNQAGLLAQANVPYILKFKSWSSVPKANRVDFEDTPENGYNRYGASTDAQAIGGRSEWEYHTTTVPQWYTFHVVFDQIKPTTQQKIQWMLSSENAITYLDSLLLMKAEDPSDSIHHFLTLSTTQISVAAGEVTAMVELTSDVRWTASTNQPWLKVSPTTGTGNRTLILTTQANTLTMARKAAITIKADGIATQTISVTQLMKPFPPGENGQPTYGEKWSDEVWNYQNLIKNWNFTTDLTNWGWWVDGVSVGPKAPEIKNGVAVMGTTSSTDGNNWHYQLSQNGLKALPNIPYVLKFKSWSSAPRSNGLVFEDSPENNYNRYGASKDANALNGRAEWTYYTTIEPRWYTFHVVFDRMKPTTIQKLQWMLSTANATTYLDSVILVKDGDSAIVNDGYLILSKNKFFMEEKVANSSFSITSNTNWEVRCDQPWLSIDQPLGNGNKTITLTATANTWYTNRSATVTVYATGLEAQTISVVQNAKQGIPDEPIDSIPAEYWTSDAWNNYNLIKNWNFTSGLSDWGWWVDGVFEGPLDPVVINETARMSTVISPDGNSWHYQLMQNNLQAEPGVPYTLRFKSWSSIPRSNVLVFEDSPQYNYNRYGASTDPESLNGRAEWIYFTSARPRWYTFHVVFDQMAPFTQQKIQWMLSTADAVTYLDSVILIKDSDLLGIKEAQLALSASHLDVDHTEAQAMVDVSSNTNSLAISDQEWLTVYPPVVTGSKTIAIATQPNLTNQVRTATVTLYPAGLKSQTITVTQDYSTGAKTITEKQKMRFFPNPTTGKVKLAIDRIPPKGTFLCVYDLTGKQILKLPVESIEQWIDLKGNPPGIYLLKTNLNDGEVQKIVLK